MAEQLPLGPQAAQAQDAQGFTVVPGGEVVSLKRCAHGLCPVLPRDSLNGCLSGWGAVWQNKVTRGQWTVQDLTEHISFLELWAVHQAVRHFLP